MVKFVAENQNYNHGDSIVQHHWTVIILQNFHG